MAYNVFISRSANTDKKIKSNFSRTTSLAMGAYIFREIFISNTTDYAYRVMDRKKTPDQILFKGLLLPEKCPLPILNQITNNNQNLYQRVENVFKNIPITSQWKRNYFIDDNSTVVRFLEESDRHIKELENIQYDRNERTKDYRLYHSYVISLPVAKNHFPTDLNIKRDDLKSIYFDVILELIDKHFLNHGQAVLFAFHLDEEDEKVHVHLQVPERTLKYFYESNQKPFKHDEFLEWIRRNRRTRAINSLEKNKVRFKEWKAKFEQDPSNYNRKRLDNFINRFENAEKMLIGINDILTENIKSGEVYEFLKFAYLNPKLSNYEFKNLEIQDSYFSNNKGTVENHQDTLYFINEIKKDYADFLNKSLQENRIIYQSEKLYDFVPASPNRITVSEMKRWHISEEELKRVNKKIREVFSSKKTFFYEKKYFEGKRISSKKKHLIVHEYKSLLKKEFNAQKEIFAKNYSLAEAWVDAWTIKLEILRNDYAGFLETLINPNIYIQEWRKYIKNKLILFWQEKIVNQIIPDGKVIADVEFDDISSEENLSINEVHEVIQETQIIEDDTFNKSWYLLSVDDFKYKVFNLTHASIERHFNNLTNSDFVKEFQLMALDLDHKLYFDKDNNKYQIEMWINGESTYFTQGYFVQMLQDCYMSHSDLATNLIYDFNQENIDIKSFENPWKLDNLKSFKMRVSNLSSTIVSNHLESLDRKDLHRELQLFAENYYITLNDFVTDTIGDFLIFENGKSQSDSLFFEEAKSILKNCYINGLEFEIALEDFYENQNEIYNGEEIER